MRWFCLHPSVPWRVAGGRRQAFYADLLGDLGVSLVVALGGADYDRAPLEAAGLAVCGLDELGGDAAAQRPSLQVG